MKVVFLQEVEGTARVGEVKNVADGFARNYLLPRRLAAPASQHFITIAQAKAEKEARHQAHLDEEAQQQLLPKVEGKAVTIEVRVGEQGKLFGSVTARDIAEALQEASGVELEHRQIDLAEPIRELGSYEVRVRLTRNVQTQVAVNVEPLGGLPAAAERAAAEAPEAAAEDAAQSPEEESEEPAPEETESPEEESEEPAPEEAESPEEESEEPAPEETESPEDEQ